MFCCSPTPLLPVRTPLSTDIKNSAASIALAVSVTALFITILALVASQGAPLGPINALVTPLSQTVINSAMIITSLATVVSLGLYILLHRSYANQKVSYQELENAGVIQQIKDDLIFEQLLPDHYWKVGVDADPTSGKAGLYAVALKNHQGQTGVIGFRTEIDRQSYLECIDLKDGSTSLEWPAAYIQIKVPGMHYSRTTKDMEAYQDINFYNGDERLPSCWILTTKASKEGEPNEVRYFKTEDALDSAFEEEQYLEGQMGILGVSLEEAKGLEKNQYVVFGGKTELPTVAYKNGEGKLCVRVQEEDTLSSFTGRLESRKILYKYKQQESEGE